MPSSGHHRSSDLPSTIKVLGRPNSRKESESRLYEPPRGKVRESRSSKSRRSRKGTYEPPQGAVDGRPSRSQSSRRRSVSDYDHNDECSNHRDEYDDDERDERDEVRRRTGSRDRSSYRRHHGDRDRRHHHRHHESRGRSHRRYRESSRGRRHELFDSHDPADDETDYYDRAEYEAYEEMHGDGSPTHRGDLSTLDQFSGSGTMTELEDDEPTSRARKSTKGKAAYELGITSMSTEFSANTGADDYFLQTSKQDNAYASIAVTSVQLLVLMLQLCTCGFAPIDINPMLGPFPDAFSDWGGKNAYLMIDEQQYWRFVTPAFLHVGILHLVANSFCLLYSSALFEREWGSWTWLFIFLISEVGCIAVSSVADPETIAVGSSGALMGLFAAKMAHVMTYMFFETTDSSQDDGIHVDQLSGVLCGLTLVALLSFFTYIDWSGHTGGLGAGFFGGMLVFSRPIKSCCGKFLWGLLGLAGLAGMATLLAYLIVTELDPDPDMANACDYFRNLFPEDYECGCLW